MENVLIDGNLAVKSVHSHYCMEALLSGPPHPTRWDAIARSECDEPIQTHTFLQNIA